MIGDSNFSRKVDQIFETTGIKIIKTPLRVPQANAYAERWVRSIREECLDRILIVNELHLRRVLREYESYYNEARPHQGINQRIPLGNRKEKISTDNVRSRKVLGGLINDYYRSA